MINVFGSYVGSEELAEIKDCIDNQWLGMGKKTDIFEKMMASKLGLKDFIATDNCSNALYMAVKLLNLPKGSHVIVPTINWISGAIAVLLAGCTPVFADCDYETLNVTQETLYTASTRKTKALMIMHYAGYPIDYFDTNLPIIADCAHAVDSNIDDSQLGILGDIAVFSFNSIKNVACGELGGICSIHDRYSVRAKEMRYCGLVKSGLQASTDKDRWWEYELKEPFIKMLPNDITASIGIAQLKKLDKLQARRKEIWDIYQSQLRLSWIDLPVDVPHGWKHSYFTYAIKILNGKRDELARYLLDNGIYTTVRYEPLHLYKQFGKQKRLPVAEELNETLLNIPLHPNLSNKDLEYVIEKIKQFN
jgi:aminotransferase